MLERLLFLASLLLLGACGDASEKDDTAETAAPEGELDGVYGGTLNLSMSGGGGDGSCAVPLELVVQAGAEPEVAGSACCAVEGLSSHGDVDICLAVEGALEGLDALAGDLWAYEEGYEPGEVNGSWSGDLDAAGTVQGAGSGSMAHDVGSTSFELAYEIDFELSPAG
jgi:hypothetical protein